MEQLWLEFVPDLGALRAYCHDGDIRVEKFPDHLVFNSNSHRLNFPISPDSSPYISAPESSGSLTIISVKLDGISVDDVENFFAPLSALFEDWSKINGKLNCRSCNCPIDCLDFNELTPCLLPSATWGFEDMRVCEECGPLVVGDMRSHRHEKKSKRKNLFIDSEKVFMENQNEVRCAGCDILLGSRELSAGSVERLKIVNKFEDMIEFKKSELSGPKFLTTYTNRIEETDALVRFVEDENDGKKILPQNINSKFFTILSKRVNELIVIPASTGIPIWGIRLMYHDDSLIGFSNGFRFQLERFATPSLLKKNWFSAIIAPISPQILEL